MDHHVVHTIKKYTFIKYKYFCLNTLTSMYSTYIHSTRQINNISLPKFLWRSLKSRRKLTFMGTYDESNIFPISMAPRMYFCKFCTYLQYTKYECNFLGSASKKVYPPIKNLEWSFIHTHIVLKECFDQKWTQFSAAGYFQETEQVEFIFQYRF